jgi:amino acid transporter
LFGLSYMTPIVVCATLGLITEKAHGAAAISYLVATAAMLLTAHSYSVFARRYSSAGSAYTYLSESVHPNVGFMVGWALILDYCFIPTVIVLLTSISLSTLWPTVPSWIWVTGLALLSTILNALGIRITDRVNLAIMGLQLAMVAVLGGLCIHHILIRDGALGLFDTASQSIHVSIPAVFAGSAIACYSFLGFDAVSTLSEETRDPTRSIPRAIMIATAAGGFLFTTLAYLMLRAHPMLDFKNVDTAAYEIVATVGGDSFRTLFMLVLTVSFFAAALCAHAGGARLLYAMGRQGVLPRTLFGVLSPRTATPVVGIAFIGVAMLGAEFLTASASTSYINFGAFSAFLAVNAGVVLEYRRQCWNEQPINVAAAVAAAAGAVVCVFLLVSLDTRALMLGVAWLTCGAAWLLALTRGLSRPLPRLFTPDGPAPVKPVATPR